ncbi:hypothetical protein BGW38_003012 [Lunasporangiospora selenospora]|uniref:UspA domain-containing protein n=1 Tax=Lunasporangiospora selenospora TaxID=979761 RepID=A0A9P6KD55_9FUNG|nr:hypothetical protein BGW38_003012 [Lunasporangiospora selenospora]
MSAPQDHADLTIHTQRPAKSLKAKGDEDDGSQEMPLSPASVKDYNRKKAEKTKDSEEEEDDDDDDDDEDDDDDAEFDAAHLDPRLEALDGTTKLKKGDNKNDDEDDDDDEGDESPSSIEEDGSKDTDGGVVSKVEKALQDLKLDPKQSQTKDQDIPTTTNDAPTADPEASPALVSATTTLDTKDTTTIPTATTTFDATQANVTPATPTLTTTTAAAATTTESETTMPGTILPTIVVPEEENVVPTEETSSTQEKEPSGKVSLESIQDSTSESSGDHTGTGASPSQPPSGTATPSDSMISIDQRERLQEPVKPRIALPCLVETANNPARTRITLKYSGHNQLHKPVGTATTTTTAAASQPYLTTATTKVSTRGRKNYMVATDLSGESWHATEWTITTILRNGDEMNVVTIVEDDKGDITKGVKKGVQVEMREDAEKLTKNIHEQLEHTNLRDITVIIHIIAATKSMGAKELLIEMIDDLDDLATVIVGSRGRGAIKGLLLGSISNFLVHNSSVPVMVVRAPKKSKGRKNARRSRVYDHTRNVKEANLKYEQAFAVDE